MCGILGFAPSSEHRELMDRIGLASEMLQPRGPDADGSWRDDFCALAHRRLSIIDTSEQANQPMWDSSGRFVIVFNGEIYNFKDLREELRTHGHNFRTESDTEVLLESYIRFGKDVLSKLNGFFAFAIYDTHSRQLFLARDRMGIKPLVYSMNENGFCFSSEMRNLKSFLPKIEINPSALFSYLQLMYVPAPLSMLQGVMKMEAGHSALVQCGENPHFIEEPKAYYDLKTSDASIASVGTKDYLWAIGELKRLMQDSVQKRLISDVPLGGFLSGGVDSSVISLLASRDQKNFQTFSIGYRDEPMFDETEYARMVARSIGTEHTVFELSNDDLFEHFNSVLNSFDEPFADSSSLAVYILCKNTRQHISVALSGDGADELFSGYNKHAAEFRIKNPQLMDSAIGLAKPLVDVLPKGRQTKLGNLNRKMERFIKGKNLPRRDRYWAWASILDNEETNYLIREDLRRLPQRLSDEAYGFKKMQQSYLRGLGKTGDLNEILLTDQRLVLTNDMLKKVDSMSMANSLEVRVPFLDHRVVEFVNSLPSSFKINANTRKKILKDAYRKDLPAEIFDRPKHGFEVPLLPWFQRGLKARIEHDFLNLDMIEEQKIFNREGVAKLRSRLFSKNPGDAAASAWSLIVFQQWWRKMQ